MSHENVDAFKRAFGPINRWDAEGLVSELDPEVGLARLRGSCFSVRAPRCSAGPRTESR